MSSDAIAEIGYLMWCFSEGYGLAEDRAILTGGNWLLEDDSQLHPDNVLEKRQLLELAADLYATLVPIVRDQAAKEILAFVKDEHSETCPCDQCTGDEWLMFAARVVARDEDYQDWESASRHAVERLEEMP